MTIIRTVRIGTFPTSSYWAGRELGLARYFATKKTNAPIVIVPAATARIQYRL